MKMGIVFKTDALDTSSLHESLKLSELNIFCPLHNRLSLVRYIRSERLTHPNWVGCSLNILYLQNKLHKHALCLNPINDNL